MPRPVRRPSRVLARGRRRPDARRPISPAQPSARSTPARAAHGARGGGRPALAAAVLHATCEPRCLARAPDTEAATAVTLARGRRALRRARRAHLGPDGRRRALRPRLGRLRAAATCITLAAGLARGDLSVVYPLAARVRAGARHGRAARWRSAPRPPRPQAAGIGLVAAGVAARARACAAPGRPRGHRPRARVRRVHRRLHAGRRRRRSSSAAALPYLWRSCCVTIAGYLPLVARTRGSRRAAPAHSGRRPSRRPCSFFGAYLLGPRRPAPRGPGAGRLRVRRGERRHRRRARLPRPRASRSRATRAAGAALVVAGRRRDRALLIAGRPRRPPSPSTAATRLVAVSRPRSRARIALLALRR